MIARYYLSVICQPLSACRVHTDGGEFSRHFASVSETEDFPDFYRFHLCLNSLFSAFRVDGWQGKVLVKNFLSFLLFAIVKKFFCCELDETIVRFN